MIRGAAINNDGADKAGFTAPSVDGQIEVIATAQALAGIRASRDLLYRDARNRHAARRSDRDRGAYGRVPVIDARHRFLPAGIAQGQFGSSRRCRRRGEFDKDRAGVEASHNSPARQLHQSQPEARSRAHAVRSERREALRGYRTALRVGRRQFLRDRGNECPRRARGSPGIRRRRQQRDRGSCWSFPPRRPRRSNGLRPGSPTTWTGIRNVVSRMSPGRCRWAARSSPIARVVTAGLPRKRRALRLRDPRVVFSGASGRTTSRRFPVQRAGEPVPRHGRGTLSTRGRLSSTPSTAAPSICRSTIGLRHSRRPVRRRRQRD